MSDATFEHMASRPLGDDVSWLSDAEHPPGVRVLDVRPVTHRMLSSSSDPTCAENAVSFRGDDGTSFIGESPPVDRVVSANLRFPIDRFLADGVLFTPGEMEHKWALFYHAGEVICVRSWLRRVQATARVEVHEGAVVLSAVRGVFTSEGEEPEFTLRFLDYLLRSHVLDSTYPAPLPAGMGDDPQAAALWCMSMFGNRVSFATPDRFERTDPVTPLRSFSLVHIAAARGDLALLERGLAAGVPVDLLGADGLSPLHWALQGGGTPALSVLLDHGASIDVRSDEGITPLMLGVERAQLKHVLFMLDRGADANAVDERGFGALHRAAERGHLDVATLLLDRGASPNPQSGPHTPLALAQAHGETALVELLSGYMGGSGA